METIKQLCLKSSDCLCMIEEEAVYRYRFPGFFSGFRSYKNVFVSMSNVWFEPVRKNIEFRLYFGEKRSLMESDFADFHCSYGSLEELCSFLSHHAMKEEEQKEEKQEEKEEGKEEENEEGKEEEKKKRFKKLPLEIAIVNRRCVLKVPVGHELVVSSNLNDILKLKVVEDKNYPIRLLSGDHMGQPIDFLKKKEKKCYVSIERMTNSVMINSGFEVGNVFSCYYFDKKKMGKNHVFKRCADTNDEIVISLKDDCFKPFIMDCENLYFEVTLSFLIPI